jgi:hypothetical protein
MIIRPWGGYIEVTLSLRSLIFLIEDLSKGVIDD